MQTSSATLNLNDRGFSTADYFACSIIFPKRYFYHNRKIIPHLQWNLEQKKKRLKTEKRTIKVGSKSTIYTHTQSFKSIIKTADFRNKWTIKEIYNQIVNGPYIHHSPPLQPKEGIRAIKITKNYFQKQLKYSYYIKPQPSLSII